MVPGGLRHLVLVGLGMAHVQVLREFAGRRSMSLKITVVSPSVHWVHLDQVPGFVAGTSEAGQCTVSLEPLLQRCGATLVKAQIAEFDAATRSLTLSNGETLQGDLISFNTEASLDRTRMATDMPGALQHALNLRPLEAFCTLWPQVAQLATTRPLNVAVVGEGMIAAELALAIAYGLSHNPECQPCRVSLVTGGETPGAECPATVQQRITQALKRQHITVLRDRCTSMNGKEVQLASGARLVCDAPVLALGGHPPAWLAGSGLALAADGQPELSDRMHSTSHPRVYVTRDPRGHAALRTGKTLAFNLRATIDGTTARPLAAPLFTLEGYFCGGLQAIAALHTPWRDFSASGGWVWPWKQKADTARLKAATE